MGVDSTSVGSVEFSTVEVDSTRGVCVGIGPVDVGSGMAVEVESGSGWDVVVDKAALSVGEDAIPVKLSPA